MSELTEALKRWDELTAAERDALVAVHVMGWHADQDYYGHPVWNYAGKTGHADRWNPTTDRNDCAETVRAFCANFDLSRRVQEMIAHKEFETESMYLARIASQSDILSAWLLDPADVCLAMLEALVESEGGR